MAWGKKEKKREKKKRANTIHQPSCGISITVWSDCVCLLAPPYEIGRNRGKKEKKMREKKGGKKKGRQTGFLMFEGIV